MKQLLTGLDSLQLMGLSYRNQVCGNVDKTKFKLSPIKTKSLKNLSYFGGGGGWVRYKQDQCDAFWPTGELTQ